MLGYLPEYDICKYFLADSAYSGFAIIEAVTYMGLSVISGKNTQHTKKILDVKAASVETVKTFKGRGCVENFFSHITQTPCLLNNYEKTVQSYAGLLYLFVSNFVSKKTKKIVDCREKREYAEEQRRVAKKKKTDQIKRKRECFEEKRQQKIKNAEETVLRKKNLSVIIERVHNSIWKNVNQEKVKAVYNRTRERFIEKSKENKKRGRQKDTSFENYETFMKSEIGAYVKDNILSQTMSYNFCGKKLYIIHACAYAFSDEKLISDKIDAVDLSEHIQ